MGGDGGTLNNSRHEHTRLRDHINPPKQQNLRERASVTHCAASKEPLQPPHVHVDRLGNLYNSEPLLRSLLHRAREAKVKPKEECVSEEPGAFAHIRSAKRDTASVKLQQDIDGIHFICTVTRKIVTEEGGFTVGWNCGCVTASVLGVKGVSNEAENGKCEYDGNYEGKEGTAMNQICIQCGRKGTRVRLGMTLAERNEIRDAIVEARQHRASGKRKRAAPAAGAVQKFVRIEASPL